MDLLTTIQKSLISSLVLISFRKRGPFSIGTFTSQVKLQYIHTNGSFEYLGLESNSAGPVEIDITRPSIPQIVTMKAVADLGIVAMEWGTYRN